MIKTITSLLMVSNVSLAAIQPNFVDSEKASNIYHMNDRYYSPILGRFLTTDIKKQVFAEYNYTNGNPINNFDPSGDTITSLLEEVGGAIAGVVIGVELPPLGAELIAEDIVTETTITSLTSEEIGSAAEGSVLGLANSGKSVEGGLQKVVNEVIHTADASDQKIAEIGDGLENNAENTSSSLSNGRDNPSGSLNYGNDKFFDPKEEEFFDPVDNSDSESGYGSDIDDRDNAIEDDDLDDNDIEDDDIKDDDKSQHDDSKDKAKDEKKLTAKQKIKGHVLSILKELGIQGVLFGGISEAPAAIKYFEGSGGKSAPTPKPK